MVPLLQVVSHSTFDVHNKTLMKVDILFKNLVRDQKLTNKALGLLCKTCGLSVAPQKALTVDHIAENLAKPSLKPSNILSIDVGVKNFAVCRLSSDRLPILEQWEKINLYEKCSIQRFTPLGFARMVNKVLSEYVVGKNLDLILIERQRFRSMGGQSIQEAVINSNLLESMLFSSMMTLKEVEGSLKAQIESSSPKTMSSYWIRSELSSENSKTARIMLVDKWIQSAIRGENDRFALNGRFLKNVKGEELTKINSVKSATRRVHRLNILMNGSSQEISKGDDLTDALLHAMAWLDFEKNKKLIKQEVVHNPKGLIALVENLDKRHSLEINC